MRALTSWTRVFSDLGYPTRSRYASSWSVVNAILQMKRLDIYLARYEGLWLWCSVRLVGNFGPRTEDSDIYIYICLCSMCGGKFISQQPSGYPVSSACVWHMHQGRADFDNSDAARPVAILMRSFCTLSSSSVIDAAGTRTHALTPASQLLYLWNLWIGLSSCLSGIPPTSIYSKISSAI